MVTKQFMCDVDIGGRGCGFAATGGDGTAGRSQKPRFKGHGAARHDSASCAWQNRGSAWAPPSTNERPKPTDAEKFATAAKLMVPFKQWMIGANATGFVYPNIASGPASKKYNLKGMENTKFLHYETQGTFGGINLGWTNTASAGTAIDRAQWIFLRPGGPSAQLAPVVYGEPIALGWSKGGKQFLKYSKRNVGINLDWSDPVFEWTILGGTPRTRVGRGQDFVILYNLKHKMPLMHFDRTKGGDIGWPDSSKWTQSTIGAPAYIASLRRAADVMMGK